MEDGFRFLLMCFILWIGMLLVFGVRFCFEISVFMVCVIFLIIMVE